MYQYALEELVWAAARELSVDSRRTRPHAIDRPKNGEAVTVVTVSQAGRC